MKIRSNGRNVSGEILLVKIMNMQDFRNPDDQHLVKKVFVKNVISIFRLKMSFIWIKSRQIIACIKKRIF